MVHPELLNAIAAKTHAVMLSELANESSKDFKGYEEKQETLLSALVKAPSFAGNLAFEDLRDYLGEIYASVQKPLGEASVEDLKPGIAKFLGQEPAPFEFFFEIGETIGFKDGYEIGRAKFYQFASLPSEVQQEISSGWKYEYESDKGQAKDFPGYEKLRKESWYLRTATESIGRTRAFEKALENAKRAFNVASLFYLHGSFHSSREPEHTFKRWYGFSPQMRVASRYGFHHEEPLIRVDVLDETIESASRVLKAEKPTELEEAIVNSLDVSGLISAETPLYIRFLLTVIAIESLLMHGESQESISSKLAERVAVLLGDTPAWMIEAFAVKREELTSEFVKAHLAESRIRLQNAFKILYGKRSGAAHEGLQSEGRLVSEEDYGQANMLLRFSLMMLFKLKESNGLERVAVGERHDGKSLAEYVDYCKFSFGGTNASS